MKKRIIFLAGLGVGFVLGSRAGRQSYDKLKDQALSVWNDPKVQEGVDRATDTIKEQAPVVADKAKEAGEKLGGAASNAASNAASAAKDKVNDVKSGNAAKTSGAADSKTNKGAKGGKGTPPVNKPSASAKDQQSLPDGLNDAVVPDGTPEHAQKLSPATLPDVASDPEQALDNEGPDYTYIEGREGRQV